MTSDAQTIIGDIKVSQLFKSVEYRFVNGLAVKAVPTEHPGLFRVSVAKQTDTFALDLIEPSMLMPFRETGGIVAYIASLPQGADVLIAEGEEGFTVTEVKL